MNSIYIGAISCALCVTAGLAVISAPEPDLHSAPGGVDPESNATGLPSVPEVDETVAGSAVAAFASAGPVSASAQEGAAPGTEPVSEAQRRAQEAGGEASVGEAGEQDAEAPALDVVRVAPDGAAVLAGTARPDAEVEILLDGVTVGTARAGRDGSFVTELALGRSNLPRTLQLRTRRVAAGMLQGPRLAESMAALPGDPVGSDFARYVDDEAAEDPRYAMSGSVILLPSAREEDAPLAVRSTPEGISVLQRQATGSGVMLDSLSYSEAGAAIARGRGPDGSTIRGYANGRFVADVAIGPSGEWELSLSRDEAEGATLLRFDEIGRTGKVESRIETGFSYDTEGLAREVRERRIVVRPGDSLWRIAEQAYGDGVRYSLIFAANDDLIRDPNLIYPEQVFSLPELVPTQ